MAITKEQIFAVADEMDADGKSPTLAAIRKALGGGSYTTISDAMSDWKARKQAKDAPLREPAPTTLADRLMEFGAEFWASALELANGRLAAERASIELARTQLEAEKMEAAELADQVSAELEALQGRVSQLEAAEEAARGEIRRLNEENAHARQAVSTAETRAAEIEKRAADLNAELARLHQQHSDLVRALADASRRPD